MHRESCENPWWIVWETLMNRVGNRDWDIQQEYCENGSGPKGKWKFSTEKMSTDKNGSLLKAISSSFSNFFPRMFSNYSSVCQKSPVDVRLRSPPLLAICRTFCKTRDGPSSFNACLLDWLIDWFSSRAFLPQSKICSTNFFILSQKRPQNVRTWILSAGPTRAFCLTLWHEWTLVAR